MSDQEYLILFDADRIKEFVFATGRLKEIRGGSQLVRDASDEDRITEPAIGVAQEEIIYAEGGAGLLRVADATRAETLRRRLESHYAHITAGATLTAVVQPYQTEGAGFQEGVRQGERRLRMAKEDRRRRWQTAHSPFSRPCASCGARPATVHYVFGPADERLCDWCAVKRHRADDLRQDREQRQRRLLSETGWGKNFLSYLPGDEAERWLETELPETTDDLAAQSRPANYLGFLYADGNGMGARLRAIQSPDEYRRFSRLVSYSLRLALWLALRRHYPARARKTAPFELVALGGDDLILLCSAEQAVPLSITLSTLFAQISTRLNQEEVIDEQNARRVADAFIQGWQVTATEDALSLSCGVVIAHPKQPILNLEAEARALLSQAKRTFPGQAALDFHVVSTSVLRSVDQIRREEYQLDDHLLLTSRPWTMADAATLLSHVRVLKSGGEREVVPRNKLNALYQALYRGRDAAAFEAFFLRYRLGETQRDKLDALFRQFAPAPIHGHTPIQWPWMELDNGDTCTVLTDVMELYEFTHVTAPEETTP